MSSQSVGRQQLAKWLFPGLFLGAGALLLVHGVNAVVSDSLPGSVHRAETADVAAMSEVGSSVMPVNSQQFVQDILASGLFALPPPSPLGAAASQSAAVPAGPPLDVARKVALLGIVMGATGTQAILEELPGKKQALYKVAQQIPGVGELAAIEKDRVLFRDGGQEEWLDLVIVKQRAEMKPFPRQFQPPVDAPLPLAAPASPPGRRIVDRAQLIQLAASPQAYLNEARFQPHFSGNGQLDGFRVDGIRQVGVLEKAGLQNEDVLAGVNGVEIRDPGRLWEVFKQLQHERTARFNVVRQSQPMTLAVEIR